MKKLLCLVAAFAALCSLPCRAADVAAPSAILMEKETGEILFAKEEHTRREPASVTKIMTLLLTMEAIDSGKLSYDDTVTASAHASSMGGSQIWLKEGEEMTVRDLLKAVCIVSGNDAATALAEHLGGSEESFVEMMNKRAAELGMADTHFVNCTGLPAEGHETSAHDIALMSRELILHHPDIRQFTTVWMDSLRGGESMLVNTNKLVRFYRGATGLKTGSTDSAKYCVSATAEQDGMELIAVILKGETSQSRFDDAKTLLNYGFSHFRLMDITPVEKLQPIAVNLGEKERVTPIIEGSTNRLVEKSAGEGKAEVTMPDSVDAPVEKGDVLGKVTVKTEDGNVLAEANLIAAESVARLTWKTMMCKMLRMGFCIGGKNA